VRWNGSFESDAYEELAYEVTRSLRAVAAARNAVFDVESSGCIEYRGDERLLRQILTNLFENAIKVSRSPGRVGVVVSEEPGDIEIPVLDEAPTLPPEDRVRVFDRFYRAQQPEGVAASGSALGLAIVRWAAVLPGGTDRVEPRESGGNCSS
jgi:two-component system sensor histidine kinase MprB